MKKKSIRNYNRNFGLISFEEWDRKIDIWK